MIFKRWLNLWKESNLRAVEIALKKNKAWLSTCRNLSKDNRGSKSQLGNQTYKLKNLRNCFNLIIGLRNCFSTLRKWEKGEYDKIKDAEDKSKR